MTTTLKPDLLVPSTTEHATGGGTVSSTGTGKSRFSQIVLAVLRVGLGWIFLWPFLDKTFGLGYSTAGSKAWISGGSPTKGFLGNVQVGPFQSVFRSIAGNGFINWLFMLTLLGVGVALILGVVLRIAAISGSILLVLMWAAEWPMAQFNSLGKATGASNPFLDDHLIFAIGLVLIAALGAGSSLGLGKWWASRPVVASHAILR